jgi:hypothetical protein
MGFFDALGTLVDAATGGSDVGIGTALGGLFDATPSGAFSGAATLLGVNSMNNTAISLANQQQAFSASQASTIYQRGASDLAKAGINPILAYGNPAAVAQYSTPNIQPSLSMAVQNANSANDVSTRRLTGNSQVALNSAETARTYALTGPQANALTAEAGLKYKQQTLTDAQTATEQTKPNYNLALTGATTAHTANLIQDTALKAAQAQTQAIQQILIKHQITGTDATTALNKAMTLTESYKQAHLISQTDANAADAELTRARTTISGIDVNNALNHGDSLAFARFLREWTQLVPFNWNDVGSLFDSSTKPHTPFKARK